MSKIEEGGSVQALERPITPPNDALPRLGSEADGIHTTLIDRNLYLSLNEAQVAVLRNLWEGKPEVFLKEFVESVFASNKARNVFRRGLAGRDIARSVQAEVDAQGGLEKVDLLNVMQVVMDRLQYRRLDVSLEMSIGIKNVIAMQKLKTDYQLT